MALTISGSTAVTTQPTFDVNASTPAQADLLLTQYSGEVFGTFNRTTVLRPYIRVKTIKNGVSYQFPFIGGVTSDYHQPGEEIQGQTVASAAKIITVDDTIFTAVNISDFEEAIKHFDTRSEYTRQMGDELAQRYDRKGFAMLTKAALNEEAGAIAGEYGPATKAALPTGIVSADSAGFAAAFEAECYEAQRHFDETNIPANDRVIFVTPAVYYKLIQSGNFLNSDFGNAGNGSQADARIMKVAGLPIIVTNNLALNFAEAVERRGAVTTNFNVDARTVAALVMQRTAAAAVELMGVKTEQSYRHEFFAHLVTSRMANGMGVLRPECLRAITFGAAS